MAKIILDLCGGTGAWSKPYVEAGYDVRIITLPEYDMRNYTLLRDGWTEWSRKGWIEWSRKGWPSCLVDIALVHGILFAPVCTEFSLAKGAAPRDFEEAMELVEAGLRIIWTIRAYPGSQLKFWALENPVGFLRQFLGKPAYTFEQWEYGHAGVKRTDLWGYLKPPTPTVKTRPGGLSVRYPNGRANGRGMSCPICPPEYKHMGLDRAAIRAITPKGFAEAFYRANK
ncbi:MAG: hypothetical protein FWG40_00865 [Peptococcaceae bacterium]|nr:hypothetical protein [Peptococcaceae bacterium]